MIEFNYTITDELGLHARPAGALVKEAKQFQSRIIIVKDDKEVEATKLMAVMGMGIKKGQTISVRADGADEEQASESLKKFFTENL